MSTGQDSEAAEREEIFARMSRNHEQLVDAEIVSGTLSREKMMSMPIARLRELAKTQINIMRKHRLVFENAEGSG